MTPFLAIVAGLCLTVVALHMTRPHNTQFILSAARFFRDLPPADPRSRWQFNNPLRSRPLYLQLPIALLILAAFWPWNQHEVGSPISQALGLWILVDRSASMTTGNGERMLAAQLEATQIVALATQTPHEGKLCFRLSTFDLVREDNVTTDSADRLVAAILNIDPRPLGTDLRLVRQASNEMGDANDTIDCQLTHLVVITDQPPLNDLIQNEKPVVIWRSVGRPVENIGFSAIEPTVDPLTGAVRAVKIEVSSFGPPPSDANLTILNPNGENRIEHQPTWQGSPPIQRWREEIVFPKPGHYHLTLQPGGSYHLDDQIEIVVPPAEGLRVDWRMEDTTWPTLLGWQPGSVAPDLRVISFDDPLSEDSVPTLIVGPGYTSLDNAITPIGYFLESPLLLADLDFDAIEQVLPPQIDLPQGFQSILQSDNSNIWMAKREFPPAIYIPGLPLTHSVSTEDAVEKSTTLLFFNAMRWLVDRDTPPPLYTLTSPTQPEPEGTRVALHPDEGNTMNVAIGVNAPPNLFPQAASEEKEDIWPWFLAAALGLLCLERTLTAWGGRAWR